MEILMHFFLNLSTCLLIACTHRNRRGRTKWSEMEGGRKSEREVLIWEMLVISIVFKIANHRNRKTVVPSTEDVKLSYRA